MIVFFIVTLILALIVGAILIAEWSYIAVKEFEYEQQDKRESRRA